jgi:WD40 repeat protein
MRQIPSGRLISVKQVIALSQVLLMAILWYGTLLRDNKLQEFTRADVAVFTLKFMEDDNLLIAGYEDGQIILWRSYETNEIIAWTQANRFIRDLTCLERTQYRVEPFCDA